MEHDLPRIQKELETRFPYLNIDAAIFARIIDTLDLAKPADPLAIISNSYRHIRENEADWFTIHDHIVQQYGKQPQSLHFDNVEEMTESTVQFINKSQTLYLATGSFNTSLFNNDAVISAFKDKIGKDFFMNVYFGGAVMLDDYSNTNRFFDEIVPLYFHNDKLSGIYFNNRLNFHFLSDGCDLLYQVRHYEFVERRISLLVNNSPQIFKYVIDNALPSIGSGIPFKDDMLNIVCKQKKEDFCNAKMILEGLIKPADKTS